MSKELTPLEALKSFLGTRGWYDDEFQQRYDFVKKSLKALEIIKECFGISEPVGIDVENNKVSFGCLVQKKDLTKEEFDLLKEVLL